MQTTNANLGLSIGWKWDHTVFVSTVKTDLELQFKMVMLHLTSARKCTLKNILETFSDGHYYSAQWNPISFYLDSAFNNRPCHQADTQNSSCRFIFKSLMSKLEDTVARKNSQSWHEEETFSEISKGAHSLLWHPVFRWLIITLKLYTERMFSMMILVFMIYNRSLWHEQWLQPKTLIRTILCLISGHTAWVNSYVTARLMD